MVVDKEAVAPVRMDSSKSVLLNVSEGGNKQENSS